MRRTLLALASIAVLVSGSARFVRAQVTPDPVSLQLVSAGHGKVRLTVTAGPSGAPNGFEVCWMTAAQFASGGSVWPATWAPGEGWDDFTGVGTLNTWGSGPLDFRLGPNQSVDVEIGDTNDETGVSGTWHSELVDGTTYVFCATALGGASANSPLSVTLEKGTTSQGRHCTFTIGYWKNHPSAWPVSSLTLGSVSYSKAQLLQILGQPTVGNGLVSLAKQLIAAKLNLAMGADGSSILPTVAAADALIGALVVPPIGSGHLAPSGCSGLTQTLDDFNNDEDDHGRCANTPARVSTWGGVKSRYR